jgi:hypothetical protein
MAADSILQYNDIVDFRYNPFTGEFTPLTIGRNGNPVERRTVPNSAPYHIKLFEVPEQTTPSSMRVIETVSGDELDEVSATATPASKQYRATYYNELAPGILGFNSAQAGIQMDISYNGLGHGYQKISLDTRVPDTGNTAIAGIKNFTDITDAVSKDTGGIICEGGMGVEKKIHAGDNITSDNIIRGINGLYSEFRNTLGVESSTSLHHKIIEIGDWNMDLTPTVTINHGLGSNYEKIRAIDVIIKNDLDSTRNVLTRVSDAVDPELINGGIFTITSTVITLVKMLIQH